MAGSVVLGVPGVRACLIVSADGLTLEAHPAGEEARAHTAWSRLSSLGAITRGFVTMDTETWAVSHNGRYGVVLLAETAVRPGALLDLADQVLDEVARRRARPRHPQEDSPATAPSLGPAGREATRGGPARRLRMPLHRDPKPAEPRPSEMTATEIAPTEEKTSEPASEPVAESAANAGAGSATAEEGPAAPEPATPTRDAHTADVDIIALAREFAGLLSEREE